MHSNRAEIPQVIENTMKPFYNYITSIPHSATVPIRCGYSSNQIGFNTV